MSGESSNRTIPKEDIENFLPIRWAFHIYCNSWSGRWKFNKWRAYLLEMEVDWDGCIEAFIKNEGTFQTRVLAWLAIENVKDFASLIKLYNKCLDEYPGKEESIE